MALDQVYQLIVRQSLFGKEIENVFFYAKQGLVGNATDLRTAFNTTMSVAIRQLQSAAVTWLSVDTTNLGDEADFEKFPFVVGGLAGAGDTLPSHDAVGYTLNPVTRAVRPGSKRFAGILEAVVQNGALTEPTYVEHVEQLRVLLDDALSGAVGSYDPVIVKFINDYRKLKTAKETGEVKRKAVASVKSIPTKGGQPQSQRVREAEQTNRSKVLQGQGSKQDELDFLKRISSVSKKL